MRISKSNVLLAAGLVLFAIGTLYFNYEVAWRKPACAADLLVHPTFRCDLGVSRPTQVRVAVAAGPVSGRDAIPVSIGFRAMRGLSKPATLRPKSLSTGASGPGLLNNRHYRTSNYGNVTVARGETIEITVPESGALKLLRAKVYRNPRDWPVWVAYIGAFLFLILAVRYREKMFLSKSTRWIPYSLVLMLGIPLFSWNL